ncbi:unnamed protein product [Cochlearia groenlandica]
MGVGGKLWDLLKPYAREQGFDYLRNKRVAVDLSFWILQHQTAVKGFVLKPHLRLTFFRTINLFSKFGAYPVFVVDGTPSPLKSHARISRFFRSSGLDASDMPTVQEGFSFERNKQFCEWVLECVELLTFLGLPVLKAKGEAEALCAQLNSQGYVCACITPDSDAFLFGAKCVVKTIKPNSREPFECYHMSDIEAGLGLKRKHLIAMSLLVGNDYDSGGVLGIGVDKALRIVRVFSDDEILERLQDMGKGFKPALNGGIKLVDDGEESFSETKKRSPHCSRCGHPGSKRTHFKSSCEECSCDSGCIKKPIQFTCECSFCCKDRDMKKHKKTENWWIRICDKIAQVPEFPNRKIIELYLSDNFTEKGSLVVNWGTPDSEMLVDYMVYKLQWDPSYVRKMMLPMLSTIYLRERARHSSTGKSLLLYDQYEFHSIKCLKTRYGNQSFVIRWRKPKSISSSSSSSKGESEEPVVVWEEELVEEEDSADPLDGFSEPQVQEDDKGKFFLVTDECIGLVESAFPDEVKHFMHEKKLRESKKKNVSGEEEGSTRMGVQTSITDFYRTTKATPAPQSIETEGGSSRASSSSYSFAEKKRGATSSSSSNSLSKSVRRRLLFG